MNIEIGSYEAKTKLPELLRNVQLGKRYTITLRGEPIADLVPTEGLNRIEARSAVERMKQIFLEAEPILGVNVKDLINEGRA